MSVVINVEAKIRLMRVDDLPQVQAIDEISFSNPWPKNAYRYELQKNPNACCWVAEVDDKVVGLLVCWLVLDEVHIATIAVHPDHRGEGISKSLVLTGLIELIPKGALSATLEVRAGNFVAKNLYRHFGFKEVGLRKRYYRDTHEDGFIMTVEPLGPKYQSWLESGAQNPWNDSTPSQT